MFRELLLNIVCAVLPAEGGTVPVSEVSVPAVKQVEYEVPVAGVTKIGGVQELLKSIPDSAKIETHILDGFKGDDGKIYPNAVEVTLDGTRIGFLPEKSETGINWAKMFRDKQRKEKHVAILGWRKVFGCHEYSFVGVRIKIRNDK